MEEFKTVKNNVKSENLKDIVKELERAIFGYDYDDDNEEPKFEESIAERTKMRRQNKETDKKDVSRTFAPPDPESDDSDKFTEMYYTPYNLNIDDEKIEEETEQKEKVYEEGYDKEGYDGAGYNMWGLIKMGLIKMGMTIWCLIKMDLIKMGLMNMGLIKMDLIKMGLMNMGLIKMGLIKMEEKIKNLINGDIT